MVFTTTYSTSLHAVHESESGESMGEKHVSNEEVQSVFDNERVSTEQVHGRMASSQLLLSSESLIARPHADELGPSPQ